MENQQTTEVATQSADVSKLIMDASFRKMPMMSEAVQSALQGKPSVNEAAKVTDKSEAGANSEDAPGEDQGKAQKSEDKGNDSGSDEDISQKVRGRFKAITEARERAERRNAELEAELAKYKRGESPTAEKPAASEPSKNTQSSEFVFDKPEPDAKDFKTVSEYTKALSRFEFERLRAEEKFNAQKESQVQSARQQFETFSERGKSVEKELGLRPGEFDLFIRDPSFVMSDPAKNEILGSEFGARIAIEIAMDDGTKESFAKMSPAQQVKYIGKLEARFEATQKENQNTSQGGNKKTSAKPIGSDVKGSGNKPFNIKGKPINSYSESFSSQREFREALKKQ